MRVLIADDEKTLAAMLCDILKQNHINADMVFNGRDAIDYALIGNYDLIVLDVMMPTLNGFEVLKTLRAKKLSTPVMFLTAKGETDDIIEGLNLGADDYLAKPFATGEFVARVKALLRRKPELVPQILEYNGLKLDKNTLYLYYTTNSVRLSSTEFKIMELFLENKNKIIPKDMLFEKVWGFDSETDYNSAEVYISFLRKKLLAIKADVFLKSVRGVGYTLSQEE